MTSANTVLMIRPKSFGFNEETALSNVFQKRPADLSFDQIQKHVDIEFQRFAKLLQQHQIKVLVFDDTLYPEKPDAIFPNNWIATGENWVALFPMLTANRRAERRTMIVEILQKHYAVDRIIDYTHFETQNKFLEGTGSMVFDHSGRQVFASLSPRTDAELVKQFATEIGYQPIIFDALDRSGKSIYHTNVLVAIGAKWACICFESIPHEADRKKVRHALESSDHEICDLSFTQLENFAGNMLELTNAKGEIFIIMSQTAKQSLDKALLMKLEAHGKILTADISTIEKIGGGSVRCMLAEIFLKANA